MTNAARTPVALVLLLACDLARPVLEDEDPEVVARAQLIEDTCESLAQCCGMQAPGCADELDLELVNLAFDRELAAEYGLEPARDEACPLLPFQSEVGARCAVGESCVAPCKPFAGTVARGEPCRMFGTIDDCEQGLLCFVNASGDAAVDEGICDDACDRVGQACDEAGLEWPTGGNYLGAGSWPCGPVGYCGVDGTCAPVLQEGEACPDGIGCAKDLYCDFDSVCAAQVAEGEPCNHRDQCLAGNWCDEIMWTCYEEYSAADPEDPLGCQWLVDHGL